MTVLPCRPQRKKVHWISHSLAAVCAVLGLTAAWRSHTLKASAWGAAALVSTARGFQGATQAL